MSACCPDPTARACPPSNPVPSGRWITGRVMTLAGPVPTIATRLTRADTLDRWKARWGIGRMHLRVTPGLYAVGHPGPDDIVLVTANYKPSFDALRGVLSSEAEEAKNPGETFLERKVSPDPFQRTLAPSGHAREPAGPLDQAHGSKAVKVGLGDPFPPKGSPRILNAWILVLDTKGINVWCAAGKGTFGTEELVRRIAATRLASVVRHRTLILPQLGAPGVAGHTVKTRSGFQVVYGPVRAKDLPVFLAEGATPAMRTVGFGLMDRLAVVPVELVRALQYFLIWLALVGVWQGFHGAVTFAALASATVPLLGALLMGTVGVPVLLPWLPPRAFALKGWLLGLLWTAACGSFLAWDVLSFLGNLLLLPAIAAFLALNFTGSTTFTSQNGVNREIGWFARPMAAAAVIGILLLGVDILGGVLP